MKVIYKTIGVLCFLIGNLFGNFLLAQEVLSFKEWKSQKVQNKLQLVVALKQSIELKKVEFLSVSQINQDDEGWSPVPQIEALETLKEDLKKAEQHLEIERLLDIKDYFMMYVLDLKNKQEAFLQIAQRSTPEEIRDLFLVYEKFLNNRAVEVAPPDASLVADFIRNSEKNRR